MEEETTLIFLDAVTTTGLRMTSFGGRIEHCLNDLKNWIDSMHILPEQLAHADLYEKVDAETKPVNIGVITMMSDGEYLIGKPANPKEFIEAPDNRKTRRIMKDLEKAFKQED